MTVGTQGTIPFFKTNMTFGGIDLPSSGTYVLTMDGTTPSLEVFNESLIFGTMGYDNTPNRYAIANWNSTASNHKDPVLPNKSWSFFLHIDSSNNYDFATINAKSFFHDILGIESDAQKIVTYWDDQAYGSSLPTTTGYATFKIENSSTSPVITNLTPSVIYKDILGCTSEEHCLVYNNGNEVSKLAIPTSSGKYMLAVNGDVQSFVPQDTKLSKTFEYTLTSGHEIVSESFTSADTNRTEAITLKADTSNLITIDAVIWCSNYEQVLMGFTSMPNLVIGADTARIINMPLNNPLPITIASGSSVITPTKTNPLTIEMVGSGDTTITHYFQQLKVSVVEL